MSRTVVQTLTAIDRFELSNENMLELEDLLQELFASGSASLGIDSMLRVFERHPVDEDGAGVFWSILHGLESLPDYEIRLIESVRRVPSEFGLVMVNRLLNGGIREVQGVSLVSLLEHVLESDQTPVELRRLAARFLTRHRGEPL